MSTIAEAVEQAMLERQKEAAAAVSPLRALCPHGGDDSQAHPGPGRTGVCDSCAMKLLEERNLAQQVLGDLLQERGLDVVTRLRPSESCTNLGWPFCVCGACRERAGLAEP